MKKVLLPMVVFVMLILYGNSLFAQTPFSCIDVTSYQIRGNPSALFTVNLRTGAATPLFTASSLGNRNLTGLGYNVSDDFLYASVSGTNNIVRIGDDGIVTQITVPGLPASAYSGGDVTVIGGIPYLYLYVASATTMQRVNLNTFAVSNITITAGANVSDISINVAGTRIYGISSTNGNLVSWSTTGGALTSTNVGAPAAYSASTYMDPTGDLFTISDGSSSVYEISGPSFPNANSQSRITANLGLPITNTDGARCVSSFATTQPAFGCVPNQSFVSTTTKGLANNSCAHTEGQSTLVEYNLSTGAIISTSPQLIENYGAERTTINNLGYNVTDNYLWAYRFGTNQLVRIGLDRSVDFFAIPGLSNNCLYPETGIDNTIFFSGDVNADGVMYLLNGIRGDRFIRVDLNPSSPTYLTKLPDVILNSISPGAGTLSAIQDLAFNPIDGFLYTISTNGNLIRINSVSGLVTNLGVVTGIPSSDGGYVVSYFDNAGTLYVQKANSTAIVRVPNVAAGNLSGSTYGTGASFSGGDGARCPFSPIAPALYSLSGNVLNDGNGLNDTGGALVNTSGLGALNPVDGTTSLGVQLYVTLVNSDGNDIATVPVSATGTYNFSNVAPGAYSTVLGTSPDGTTTANSPLSMDWASTGEQLGLTQGNTDGSPNGIVAGITIANANVINANFGINKKPVVVSGIDASRANPGGIIVSPVASTLFQGSDLEDGSYTAPASTENNNLKGRTVNLEPGTGGDVYYNGILVVANDPPITNFDPTLVTVDPAGTNNQDIITVTFSYTVTDNAGVVSDPKDIQVPFTANPLPVKLISFDALKADGNTSKLEWATTEEINSAKFEIERSGDAKFWNYIGQKSASGESKLTLNYEFTDVNPLSGINYYRLKMIDLDNSFSYSRIQSLSFNNASLQLNFHPNPVADKLFVKDTNGHTLAFDKVRDVSIVNTLGVVVYRSPSPVTGDGIDVSGLAAGMYVVKITLTDGTLSTQKVIVGR